MKLRVVLPVSVLAGVVGAAAWAADGSKEAQAGAQEAPIAKARFDGDKVVRVQMRDLRDVRLMQTLSQDPWTCSWDGISPGRVDFRVSAEAFEALVASAIPFQVKIGDVQTAVEKERAQNISRDAAWYADYKDYAAVDAYLNTIVAARPDLASRVTLLPLSVEGRALPMIRVSSAPVGTKPAVVVEGCQHAREWITVMATTYVADQLISRYDSDPAIKAIVDNYEVYVIPIVNPDGYAYTWSTNRLWRKNRRPNGGSPATFGVDLNRNWAKFWTNTFGNSSTPSSDLYKGPTAFSEPCTRAVRDFLLSKSNIAFFFDVHSFSQLLLAPWGGAFTLPPDTRALDQMMDSMQKAMFAVQGQTYLGGATYRNIYPASGTAQDWAYDARPCLGMGLELRDFGENGFLLPADQIVPASEEFFAGFRAAMQWGLGTPIAVNFPNERPTRLQSGAATSVLVQFNRGLKGVASTPGDPPIVYSRMGKLGPFTGTPLANAGTDESGQLYSHSLSAGACSAAVQWYYEVKASDGSTVTIPAGGAGAPYQAVAGTWSTVRSDDFQSATTWVVGDPSSPDNATSGVWTRVDPNGYQAQAEYDHSPLAGTNCYYTGNTTRGTADQFVSGGKTTLRSPVIDLSAAPSSEISFYLWYFNDRQYVPDLGNDPFVVDITNNAGATPTWVRAITVAGDGPVETTATTAWRRYSFKPQDFVAPTSAVQVRFVASGGTTGLWVEAGIDDFNVLSFSCSQAPCVGDFNGDGARSVQDLFDFLGRWFAQDLAADFNKSGTVTVQDLFDFLGAWFAPCP